MTDSISLPSDMWGALLRIEGSTSATNATVQATQKTVSDLKNDVDHIRKEVAQIAVMKEQLAEHSKDIAKLKDDQAQTNMAMAARVVVLDDYRTWKTSVDVKLASAERNDISDDAKKRGIISMLNTIKLVVGLVAIIAGLFGYETLFDHPHQSTQSVSIERHTTVPVTP